MFILIMLILESSSSLIETCAIISIIDVPCDQECIVTKSPDNEVVNFRYSCMKDYTNLKNCLISINLHINEILPSLSSCFSNGNYIKIQQSLSLLESQFECISFFTASALKDFLEEDKYFHDNRDYVPNNTDIKDCKKKAHDFGKILADYAFKNIKNGNAEDIIMLLLKNHGEFLKVEEGDLKTFFQEELRKDMEEANAKFQKEQEEKYRKEQEEKNKKEQEEKFKKEQEEKYRKEQEEKYRKEQDEKFERLRSEYEKLKRDQSNLSLYSQESSLYNQFVSAIIKILDTSGMYIYCAVNRLDHKIPISKLKDILPESIINKLIFFSDEAKKIVNTDEYVCSESLDFAIDTAISLLLIKENYIYTAATHTFFSFMEYLGKEKK